MKLSGDYSHVMLSYIACVYVTTYMLPAFTSAMFHTLTNVTPAGA